VIAVHKELAISISDLRYVCIECPACRTKVILDMREKSEFAQKHSIFAPK
jgi:DNA-directed RNA polymerase subunit RPC12/RpoP